MKVKRVNRYYCEHCKKSGCSARHIRHHEERCTMNPDRKCGMCANLLKVEQQPTETLLALLPEPESLWSDGGGEAFGFIYTENLQTAMKKLREVTEDCPACILAALRQKGIPVALINDFNFTAECEAVWAEINRENYERSVQGYY